VRPEPLPPADPAYSALLDVLAEHRESRVVAGTPDHELLCDLLEVIVQDRLRHAGPVEIEDFFGSLTDEQRVELIDPDPDDVPPSVVVRSGVTPTGVYTVMIECGPDHVRSLVPTEVVAYVQAMFTAAWQAQFDAAVFAQLRDALPQDERAAADMLISLRGSRISVDQKALRPLIVRPCISAKTGDPFLTVRIAGTKGKWQWSCDDVVHHAVGVHKCMETADLDALYRRLLVAQIGLSDSDARRMVSGLAKWRV